MNRTGNRMKSQKNEENRDNMDKAESFILHPSSLILSKSFIRHPFNPKKVAL
jgi:hypothetical protein